jgi:thiol:disulfide interchange protein DsbA
LRPGHAAARGRRGVLRGAAATVAAAALAACGSTPQALVADRDYALVDPPVPAGTPPGRIEVLEFFWYGCPHCADMHPHLMAWAGRAPADVHLQLRPAVLTERWAAGARLHHTLVALGAAERLAGAAFDAVQLDGIELGDEAAAAGWAEQQGLDRSRFLDLLRSPQVRAATEASARDTRRYQLRGVPAIVIDGRYLTSNGYAGSSRETLAVADALIERVRRQRLGAA